MIPINRGGRKCGKSGLKYFRTHLQWAENGTRIEKICLEVFADNKHAISLYKKLGFTEEGTKRNAIKTPARTYQTMSSMAYFLE